MTYCGSGYALTHPSADGSPLSPRERAVFTIITALSPCGRGWPGDAGTGEGMLTHGTSFMKSSTKTDAWQESVLWPPPFAFLIASAGAYHSDPATSSPV